MKITFFEPRAPICWRTWPLSAAAGGCAPPRLGPWCDAPWRRPGVRCSRGRGRCLDQKKRGEGGKKDNVMLCVLKKKCLAELNLTETMVLPGKCVDFN